ncbi:MAG: immunoglobulin domain-containing protein [Verrucomicrobia bacterium]|nr:immunoglobulin domain-containing protein [Verrucomicrobiota bacterium]
MLRQPTVFKAFLLFLVSTFFLNNPVIAAEPHVHAEGGCLGEHEASEGDVVADLPPQAPDFSEDMTGIAESSQDESQTLSIVAGPIAPAGGQPAGALSGRIVYTTGGHGWTWEDRSTHLPNRWRLQRGVGFEMNEDSGNLDQMNMFATYCFNAGATVVAMRPIDYQTNEVVLDNVSAGVTFGGTWNNSTATSYYYGQTGQVPYRWASLGNSETATATYTPNIPVAGFYPVYTWVRHGSDRGDQLYRINHTGGQSTVRIPHHMVGNGWVYLGTYYLNNGASAANGSVIISNLRGSATGSVIIADAIRFGNGMGSIDRGGGVSTYPREEENSRYWVQTSMGVGMPSSIWDAGSHDESDSWYAPPRMAREMNREASGNMYKRIYVNFHSNAGGGRGAMGLINGGNPTPNQADFARICGDEVQSDLLALGVPPLEVAWHNRGSSTTYSGGYAEISNGNISGEFDGTIIEVAFHDSDNDTKLMKDPKARSAVARASYHAVIKYMNKYDSLPLNFIPEPPTNVRAIANSSGVAISWNLPVSSGGSSAPTGYVVYRSADGYGFGNPVSVSGSSTTSVTLTDVAVDTDFYYRVAAVNAGGESLPTETVGCRRSSNSSDARILVVNGFNRFERTQNLRQSPTVRGWKPPGPTGTFQRVTPRSNNSFDYVVQHGKAIDVYGMPFDSCNRQAVANNQVNLGSYNIVVWMGGQQLTGTLDSTLQSRISTFLAGNGSLFISGSEIANELGKASASSANKLFLQNQLRATLASDSHTNSQTRSFVAVSGSIFAGNPSGTFDDGTKGTYWVQNPDRLTPASSTAAINYSGGIGGAAAIQYNGSSGGGRVVFLGFPFETITSAATRNAYMYDALTFLNTSLPPGWPGILTQPQSQTLSKGANATFTVTASGTPTLGYQWKFNNANISGATQSSYTRLNIQTNHAGEYTVTVTNSIGQTTSQPATLTVNIPTVTTTVYSDTFDSNTAANWTVNRSTPTSNNRVTFNYDYSLDGIPSAPNSTGGTRRGVKFEANMTSGASAAINISPSGQSFTGDYKLRFDMWINANGPFPDGGPGSTEHLTAGVGTAGNRVQWTNAPVPSNADGIWFAVDGEGGTAVDFGAYAGISQQAAASGVYAAGTASNSRDNAHSYYAATFPAGQTAPAAQQQTGGLSAGCVGLKWRNVLITKTGSTVEWFIDGLKIATVNNATYGGNNFFIGYWDMFASLSSNGAQSFGLVDNVRVEVTTEALPPTITGQPQPVTVAQGGNATFNVSATGTTNLIYQWRFNGTNISGASQSSYTRLNVQPSHAGNYSVVVTNIAGTVTSANASLTVNTPPLITAHPQDETVFEGNSVTFNVTSTGTGPLNYQWRFNGDPIPAATMSTYTIEPVLLSDGGNYSVVITNLLGSATSANAFFTVNPAPPLITQQPESQTITEGQNVTFTVSATGSGSLTYQWRFNGSPITDATTTSYTRSSALIQHAGEYSVAVSDGISTVFSDEAVLTVNMPDFIIFDGISLLSDGSIQLLLSGEPATYAIETSSNLVDWLEITNVVSTNGTLEFTDLNATNVIRNFYRAKRVDEEGGGGSEP